MQLSAQKQAVQKAGAEQHMGSRSSVEEKGWGVATTVQRSASALAQEEKRRRKSGWPAVVEPTEARHRVDRGMRLSSLSRREGTLRVGAGLVQRSLGNLKVSVFGCINTKCSEYAVSTLV